MPFFDCLVVILKPKLINLDGKLLRLPAWQKIIEHE